MAMLNFNNILGLAASMTSYMSPSVTTAVVQSPSPSLSSSTLRIVILSAMASSKLRLTALRTNANAECPSSIASYMSLEFRSKRISLPAMVPAMMTAADPDDEGDNHDGIFGGWRSVSFEFRFCTATAVAVGASSFSVWKNAGTGTAVDAAAAAATVSSSISDLKNSAAAAFNAPSSLTLTSSLAVTSFAVGDLRLSKTSKLSCKLDSGVILATISYMSRSVTRSSSPHSSAMALFIFFWTNLRMNHGMASRISSYIGLAFRSKLISCMPSFDSMIWMLIMSVDNVDGDDVDDDDGGVVDCLDCCRAVHCCCCCCCC
mmetsp:Transcript_14682/g.28030  ORF Transcript_14682/g.28030 Transcript_14682/m.28030 type:complete len:317 (+) Transcript_14682:81-1031(+)